PSISNTRIIINTLRMRQYVLMIIVFVVASCSRKITNINCDIVPTNKQELQTFIVRDSFYVEDIRMKPDIVNFNNTGTDSFFRMYGKYMVKKIENQIEETYKNGVFINDLFIYEYRDFLADSTTRFLNLKLLAQKSQNIDFFG